MNLDKKIQILDTAGISYDEIEDGDGSLVVVDGEELLIYTEDEFIELTKEKYMDACERELYNKAEKLGISIDLDIRDFSEEANIFELLAENFEHTIKCIMPYSNIVIMEKEYALDFI